MAISIPDFNSFQLDVRNAVRRAMRLCFTDALSSRKWLSTRVGDGFAVGVDFGMAAGEPSLARSHLGFDSRSRSASNQPLQHNAYDRPFSFFLNSPVRRG
jgi:hypothetical protein